MPLSWIEIRQNAFTFSKEWETETSEDAEAQSFWNEFFEVFGISRRRVASFEKSVKKSDGKDGYIDLLWKGVLVDPHQALVKNINPYLVEGDNILIQKRTSPICSVPAINKGSEATDFGHLILSAEEKQHFLDEEPQAKKYISVYMGGEEFINNIERYCLWLVDLDTTKLNSMPKILERVILVREARLASDKQRTKEWAAFPTLFSENRQPNSDYLVIPKVSSENEPIFL